MNSTVKPGLFPDRREAGRLLAQKLAPYANRPDVLVLALPRGGVDRLGIPESLIDVVAARERQELARRERLLPR